MNRRVESSQYYLMNLPVALVLLAGTALLSFNLMGTWINDDEGQYIYEAWRISLGEVPYRDFLTAQMPLFLYFGAGILRMAGHSLLALRATSVAIGVIAAGLIWLAGRRSFGPAVATIALVPFFLNDTVLEVARVFRSDIYMTALGWLGLLLFISALPKPESGEGKPRIPSPLLCRRRAFLWASVAFGAATLFKLFGILFWAGCVLYLIIEALWQRRAWRALWREVLWLSAPFALVTTLASLGFLAIYPGFLERIFIHHLRQGSDLTLFQVIVKNVRFFFDYYRSQALFFWLTMPAIGWTLVRRQPRQIALLAQLATVAPFLLLSRRLYERHLVYVYGVWALLFAYSLVWLATQARLPRRNANPTRHAITRAMGRWILRIPLVLILAALALYPYWLRSKALLLDREHDTPELVAFIQSLTGPDETVLSDYQGLLFYSQRRTTYSGAGISHGATSSGQIRADRLIAEIEANDVQAVLLDFGSTAPRLAAMPDFDRFYSYVQSRYHFVAQRYWGHPRGRQFLEVYSTRELLDTSCRATFGQMLSVTGCDLGDATVVAGAPLTVTIRLRAEAPMEHYYSVALTLVDADGNHVGQGDRRIEAMRYYERWFGPMPNPETTERWRVGQVALLPVLLQVNPATPPGRYTLWMRVYQTGTNRGMPITAGSDRTSGQNLVLGQITVRAPDTPLPADALPLAKRLDVSWQGLRLIGRGPMPTQARPGDRLNFSLFWQADTPQDGDRVLRFTLTQDGQTTARFVTEVTRDFPTSQWPVGLPWHGQYRLQLGPDIPNGHYVLYVVPLASSDATQPLGEPLALGELEVAGRERLFKLPQEPPFRATLLLGGIIRLLGYDLSPERIQVGGKLQVTLYWQAVNTPDRDYTVFVHLLDPTGRISTQHDGTPDDGASPTLGWLPGEVIVDRHTLSLDQDMMPGEYRLEIGLYDAETLERLEITDGEGQPVGNHWVLPQPVQVMRP
jgi:hypothetical protein